LLGEAEGLLQGDAFMAQKLFVGGLPFATSNEQLRSLFADCGEVVSATVVTDRDTGRSRGFGFVEMATPESAEEAINRYNGRDYEGRRLQVEKAKSPSTGGGGRPARTAGGRGGRW
jgi:cold-inducible RNA-binding protein